MSAAAPEVASAPAQDATKTETEPGFKVFTGNLAYATTDEGLKAFFAPVAGEILSAQVIQRGTRSAGYGFVTLSSSAAVDKAVAELKDKELDGRVLIIEAAKPAEDKEKDRSEKRAARKAARASRRGNKAVTGEVTEAEANGETTAATDGEATKDAATGEAKKKRTKKTRKPKAKTVEGETVAETAAATTATTTTEGATTEKKAKKPRAPKRAPREPGTEPTGEPSKSVVFVANLAFNVDDEALGALFKEAGIDVVSARVVRRRFGQPRRSKGYGFVDVGDEENQKKAVAHFAGKEVSGREIAVKIAVSAPPEDLEATETAAPAAAAAAAPADATIVAH